MGGTASTHTVPPCFFIYHLVKGFDHLRIDFVLDKLASQRRFFTLRSHQQRSRSQELPRNLFLSFFESFYVYRQQPRFCLTSSCWVLAQLFTDFRETQSLLLFQADHEQRCNFTCAISSSSPCAVLGLYNTQPSFPVVAAALDVAPRQSCQALNLGNRPATVFVCVVHVPPSRVPANLFNA